MGKRNITELLHFTSFLSCVVYLRTSNWHGTNKKNGHKPCDSYSLKLLKFGFFDHLERYVVFFTIFHSTLIEMQPFG